MSVQQAPVTLKQLWAGRIFGTNTGKVFLELKSQDGGLTGTLRLADDQFGLAAYSVSGTFEGGILRLSGQPAGAAAEMQVGTVTATARLQQNGHLWGEWESSIGTAGTLELFPHVGAQLSSEEQGPGQIYTTVRDLGALSLGREDITDLIASLRRKFPDSRVVVSHVDRGAELARFSDDFERSLDRIDQLKWLKLNVQAPAGGGLTKSATIDLGQSFNRVTVQGPDESWVLGEAEATASVLKRRERRWSTVLGKYGVGLNQVVFLAALVAMPDLPLPQRAAFMIAVVGLLLAATKAQAAWIPNLSINFSKARPTWAARIWPTLLSWLISATAGLAASILYGLLD